MRRVPGIASAAAGPRDWWARRVGALTREARDTLWLLAMLALVLAPHLPHLPLWAGLGAASALAWRARLAWTDAPLPRRWLLSLLLAVSLVMTWVTYRTLLGREAGITLIVVLTTLKCLELRARRDSLVCLYLGFFLILTQFLHGQGLGTAALMLTAVWGLLTALILGQRPLGRPPLREAGREALRAMVRGLPLMVVLFVFFPRLGPLWTLPRDAQARTGLSDSMQLGDVAELAQDESIAMRLRFLDRVPPPDQRYFRGPTLDWFDGKTWRQGSPVQGIEPPEVIGPRLAYEATLEPSRLEVIPLLEGTVSASVLAGGSGQGTVWRRGLEWRGRQLGDRRLQVRAQAALQWRAQAHEDPAYMARWTQLPRGHNPRTVAWGERLRQQPGMAHAPASVIAGRILNHIRQSDFRYTLSPGLPPESATPHLIDHFWLDQRAGFCEHFAAAFTVVLRAAGVPARVVTGYQGAEPNPVDGLYVVRNSNAHAWVEYWEAGAGWRRADPTAAVAPDRVERPVRRAPFAGLPGPLSDLDPHALRRLRDLWDAVDHRWNTWVLQYSRGNQMELLRSMGWPQPDWQDLGRVLAWALSGLALASGLFIWARRERRQPSPWQGPLLRTHRALARLAGAAPPGPAPASASSWLSCLRSAWPSPRAAWQEAVLRALGEMDALRYAPAADVDAGAKGASAGQAPLRRSRDLARQIEALCRSAASTAGAHSPP